MKHSTPHDPGLRSADLVAGSIEPLRALFPEAFVEGKLDFDVLQQILGGGVDQGEEKYGLNWHGKRAARQIALKPSTGTLRPCPSESVDWDATQNLVIEGDNLEVLKLLQKSYADAVKLIYIDPPYNTGGDFIYADDFRGNIANYLLRTGQCGSDGGKTSSRAEAAGRLHTDWLNMIYPRLKLARNLLREDGVIFISIDDNELDNLMKICGEIFGEENFCGLLVWEKKKKPSFLNANMGSVTDYIVCYAKNRPQSPPFAAGAVKDGKKYPFNNAGNSLRTLTFPAGSVKFTCPDQTVPAQDMSAGNIQTELLDDVCIADGRNTAAFRLKGQWRYSQQKLDEFVRGGEEIAISKVPFRPNLVHRSGEVKKTANLLSHRTNGVPTNEDATEEIRQLFGTDVMSHPKPSGLLDYLVRAVTCEDDIVLDFFAGSGTTAHGVWAANLEDGGNRRFILVQLPEVLDATAPASKAAWEFCREHGLPPTIAEICKERLRRTAKVLQACGAGGTPGATEDAGGTPAPGDYGFRVFKLDSSNIRTWAPDRDNLAESLHAAAERLKPDRTEQDVLFELLLKLGLALTAPIEAKAIAGKTVYNVGSGRLLVCLAPTIAAADVECVARGIIDWREQSAAASDAQVVFRDSAFADDAAKAGLAAILRRHGLENVRCL